MASTRRKVQMEHGYYQIRETITHAISTLKGNIKEKQSSSARVALWNTIFPNYLIPVTTQIKQHFVDILRRYAVGCTNTQQFCFEMAVFFIDLPDEFDQVVRLLPAPYTIAMHLAFKILHDHIEYPPPESPKKFIERALSRLPTSKANSLKATIESMQSENVNVDNIIQKIYSLGIIELFDNFLTILPPHIRLHYALKYGRPFPKIAIDFSHIDLPFEFIQAIADIEGEEVALGMMQNDDDKQ
ncbi:hypothetical protein GPJ56_002752 [Histomonas meleagridis]|uniref:uncharacterized protein n=1 Tax=Histomonas meleagridis TaxID=135588 RepID=UPI003559B37E|nr:hypothetical protein GPJ56_002752 [Histomonas meleagridis]KAH0800059.1 hypothetical protein GO595_007171 [Histomonas meleagridis]